MCPNTSNLILAKVVFWLKVIKFLGDEQDQITFVTRAVRVVDLITNLDMAAFQSHSGLSIFICRLEVGDVLGTICLRHSFLKL